MQQHHYGRFGLGRMLASMMQAYRILNRIEWSAPWQTDMGKR